MITKKTWFNKKYRYKSEYVYTGWFLIGFIPLYLVRERL